MAIYVCLFCFNPLLELWSLIKQYSVWKSLEFLLSSLPMGTDGATFTTITHSSLALGQPPHSDPLPMSILSNIVPFLLSDPPFSSLAPRYMSTCCTWDGFEWPTQNHPSLATIVATIRALSYLAPHALGWAPSHNTLSLLWNYTHQSPAHPSFMDTSSGFHLRLISYYIIISCYINNTDCYINNAQSL